MRAKQGVAVSGLILIANTDTVMSTIAALQAELVELGVRAGAYHMTPPFHSQVSKKAVVKHFGMPEETTRKYLQPVIFERDPIPDYVVAAGRTMSFARVLSTIKIPQAQADLIKAADSMGVIDGICMPLFGPNGRNSFAFLLLADENKLNDTALIRQIFERHQSYHKKICALIIRDQVAKIKLSEREHEVLHWMAQGKSNQDIATILELSLGTVDTYVRRLYSKLNVNNRVSAVVEGMSRGLVLI
jgi:DNA-binding CsgD family transcriptional regulator